MTGTDTAFTARFAPLTAETFVANQTDLANYKPGTSPINAGMLADIGRATIFAPDTQTNFYARYMKSPLTRGDSAMMARFTEVTSRQYDPLAPDTALFNGQRPDMHSNVAKKNLSRQIAVEINDRIFKQFVQTEEMIGDAASAIMAASNVCYLDDMWVASKEYFSGSTRNAKKDQMHVLTHKPQDTGFAEEMSELLYDISQNKFGYKSTLYNADGFNTKSESVDIAMKKSCQYPTFKKLYADTFNPDYLKITSNMDFVDDFATPAGAPAEAGELLAMIVDPRAFAITPMPDTLTTETFRNGARGSTAYFTTYEYAFQHAPFFNVAYIFAPKA